MAWAVMTSMLGSLITLLLYLRYILPLEVGMLQKVIIFCLCLVMGCFPLLASYGIESWLGKYYVAYRYGLYFVFISCVILLTVTAIRDILWGLAYGVDKLMDYHLISSPFNKTWLAKLNLLTLAVSLVFSCSALYSGVKIPRIKTLTIVTDKLAQARKIAVLTDIHINRVVSTNKIRKIVERTNRQQPDAILLVGDILDDDLSSISQKVELLKELKAKEGVYFVTGNHEFYVSYTATVKTIQDLGITVLDNQGRTIGGQLYIAGVSDIPSSRWYGIQVDLDKILESSKPEQYRILMSHTPTDFATQNNFDLEVSGHTHGGQIFPFHIFAYLGNKYLAGLYTMPQQAKIYVSRGAGQWGPQMRFLAPSEISIINLVPKTN